MTGIIFLSLEINVFENMLGFLITLSAGLSWAIGTMIVKYGGIRSDGLIVAGWQQIIGIVPIIPFALYFDLDNFWIDRLQAYSYNYIWYIFIKRVHILGLLYYFAKIFS